MRSLYLVFILIFSFGSFAQAQKAVKVLDYFSKGVRIDKEATVKDLGGWNLKDIGNKRILSSAEKKVYPEHGGSFIIPKGKQKIIIERKGDELKSLTQAYEGIASENGKKYKVIHLSDVKYRNGKLDSLSKCGNKGGLATCSTVSKPYCEELLKAFGNVLPTSKELTKTKECAQKLGSFAKSIQNFRTNRNDGYEYEAMIADSKRIESIVKSNIGSPVKHLNLGYETLSSVEKKAQDLMKVSRACAEFFELSDHSYDTVQKMIKGSKGAGVNK